MTLKVHTDLEQGTDEWLAARRGIVTASVVDKLLTLEPPSALTVACPKCKAAEQTQCMSLARKVPTPVKTAHDERVALTADLPREVTVANNDTSRGMTLALIAERITGVTEHVYINDDMMRGILHEPIARETYASHTDLTVSEVGFLVRDDWGFQIGASPDGLVGSEGGLEIKCPRAKTHVRTILTEEVPSQYMAQVQTSLLVSGRKWWDFVSFCAGLPMWTKRVYPAPSWQNAIVAAVRAFERNAEQMTSDYLTKSADLPPTEPINDDIDLQVA